jgi:hypothetical protein
VAALIKTREGAFGQRLLAQQLEQARMAQGIRTGQPLARAMPRDGLHKTAAVLHLP